MKKSKKNMFLWLGIALVIIAVGIVTLVLVLKKEKFTVTFTVDNKVYKEIAEVKDGDTVSLPSKPKKEGYTFEGWYINGKKFDSNTEVDDNLELEAKFTINTYTVTFDYDNDTDNDKVEVTYNETVEKPKNPSKKGYNFAGWYVGEEKYDFSSPVKDDVTIVAKWTKITTAKYTVEHYLMDLSGTYGQAKDVETLIGKIGTQVTPSVKEYVGFTAPATASVEVKEDGSAIVKYYYTRNQYNITVSGNEGVKSTEGTGTYYYGATVKVSATFETGYEFASWSNNAETATFNYTVGSSDANLKVNAKLINYSITYIGVFGTTEKEITTENPSTYTIKDNISLKEASATGYTFKNYTLNDVEITSIPVGTTGNIVIKAVFEVNTYKVNFATELGKFADSTEKSLLVKYQELVPDVTEEADYIPTRDYYEFIGWSLDKETETQTLYDFNTPMVAEDITLYPIWKPVEYKITFTLDKDETCANCQDLTYNVESNFVLPVPVKKGYEFVGWIVDDTEEIITEIKSEANRHSEIKLTAKWRKIVDVNEIDEILNANSEFMNSIKDGNVFVGIKEDTTELDPTLSESLKTNFTNLFASGYVSKIEIKYLEKPYTITKETIDSVLQELQEAILNAQSPVAMVKSSINSINKSVEDLLKESLEVTIYLDEETAVSVEETNTISYTVSFRKLEKITKETMDSIVATNSKFINDHKTDHYEAVVKNTNDLVFTYGTNIAKNDVFSTMMGAGLKTAMQTFLGNENIGYIIITLEGMDSVKVTYDDIKENNFWGFGLSLLDSFETVIGKGAFDMVNEDLLNLHATLTVYAADGKYFDESFITDYNISFAVRS